MAKSNNNTLTYKLHSADGKEAGTVDLDPAVFAAPVHEGLVQMTVRWQRARTHQGTHSVINKANYKGGSRKPWAQKGTGQARAGGADSPVWVGGAVSHGPQTRTYDFRLARRSRRQALAAILTDKARKNEIVIVKDLDVKSGKTKELKGIIAKLGLADRKVALLVDQAKNSANGVGLWRAAGNLENVSTIPVSGANAFDLLKANALLITLDALKSLQAKVGA